MNHITLMEMLQHLAKVMPQFIELLETLMYVTGMIFIFRGVYRLKMYGDIRTMMSSHTEMKGPAIYFLIGSVFLFLPTTIRSSLETFFGSPNVLAITPGQDPFSKALGDIRMVLVFLGYVAFFRGWMLIGQLADSGQRGSFGKGVTYIISGILLINVLGTWNILKNTLGLS